MSVNNALLSQCLDIAKQLMSKNQRATINIMMGKDFSFEFSNQELAAYSHKNKSPSQIKRSLERQECYDLKHQRNDKIVDAKDRPEVSKDKTTKKDFGTQTNNEDKAELKDSEVQTISEKSINSKESETQTLDLEIGNKNNGKLNNIQGFANEKETEPCESCFKRFNFDISNGMCDECLVVIAEKENLYLPNKYQCEICNKKFKTKTLFRQHDNCYFKSLTFNCEVCPKIWRNEDKFEEHMQQKHTDHVCVRCSVKVKGKEMLDAHFRANHKAF